MLQNKLDQILKQKLEGYSIEPPDNLWNKIEQQLPPTTPWYDKYKYLLLLLLLISTSVGSVLVYENWIKPQPKLMTEQVASNNDNQQQTTTATTKKQNEQETLENSTTTNKNQTSKNSNSITANNNSNDKNIVTSNNNKKTATITAIDANQKSSIQQHQNNIKQYQQANKNTNQYQANTNTNNSKVSTKNKSNKSTKNKTQQASNTVANAPSTSINNSDINNSYEQSANNIERRKEETANTQMLASVDLSTIEIPKTNSVDLLSSLVSQKASILTNRTVAGIDDIGEEKEAMLQNLNEFAGYDINKGFHFGALMGLHTNFMDNKVYKEEAQISNAKNKIDFGKAFGVNIGYDFSSRYGFQTEVQYNEAGKMIEDNSNGTSIKREVNLNNLRVPFLFKYKISYINNYNSKPIVLNFLAGPQASFLIGKSYEIDGKESNMNMLNYSKTNIGFTGGIDIDLYMKRNFYFTIGARTSADFALKKGAPNNYQVGISTQFNFRMPKKIK